MRKSIFFLFIILAVTSCTNRQLKQEIMESGLSQNIRINQLGYFPLLEKHFTVADSLASEYMIVTGQGRVVFKGKLESYGEWAPSGEYLKTGDFSKFIIEGTFFIHVPGLGNSCAFTISDNIYHAVSLASMKTFYFMRASTDIDEKYVGKFARPGGHPDDTCWFHPSTGKDGGFISSPGGWYDAGDYGKYVVNAAIATGTILALHELMPDVMADASLNIPESGNGVSDLLDEVRYELEWLLTMQDEDGGVFHKLTSQFHDGITMPAETHSKRLIIGKSSAATLDFAALMAQASRAWKKTDPGFAERCLEAAKAAYAWSVAHPDSYFENPPDIGTGPYNDKILDEEFFWAAAELYCSSGEKTYLETIHPDLGKIQFRLEESWRNYVDNIGYYSLYKSDKLDDGSRKILEAGIVKLADSLLEIASSNPYGIPVSRFVWGSNSDVLNTAIVMIYANEITRELKYLNAATQYADYIFGRNATAYSFVSGFGCKTSENFHHRLLMADEHEECFPGFIAGGPNYQVQDVANLKAQGVEYQSSYPAKSYIDHSGSYASNEVCINWNAPLVFVLGYLDGYDRGR